ncbi:MAG: YceH family protein, partial [Desulfobulbaceae bacterium]|nr:YceH family protein [Desulfobulbaceae bacterium]
MNILLTDNEVRVLGCLMEKEMATPAYYPLSLNALTNACNQKSNRNPVVSYDEETVVEALNGLREQELARQSNVSRVPKYEQIFSQKFNLITREEAVICILLVRGPQTIGEIRNRSERLYAFQNLDEV